MCSFMDMELQQRAVEYGGLERMPDVASRNVTAMPPWEKRKSLLLRRFAQREVGPPESAAALRESIVGYLITTMYQHYTCLSPSCSQPATFVKNLQALISYPM